MDLKEKNNNLDVDVGSSTESNFRSLYGLTPIVENAISVSVRKKHKLELKKLITPLHPADQADMLERLSADELNTAISFSWNASLD